MRGLEGHEFGGLVAQLGLNNQGILVRRLIVDRIQNDRGRPLRQARRGNISLAFHDIAILAEPENREPENHSP